MFLLSLLLACSQPESITVWEGYLFQQSAEGMVPLTDAYSELLSADGEFLQVGVVPNGRPSHYHRFTIDEEIQNSTIAIRVSNDDSHSVLWNGLAPTAPSTWLPGGLFALDSEFGNTFLESFASTVDVDLTGSIHLWGEPLRSEEWVGVQISLYDDVQEYPVYTFSQLPNGLISASIEEGIDWFFAWNLPANPLTLRVELDSGTVIETNYSPQEGDILSALYYALPALETP